MKQQARKHRASRFGFAETILRTSGGRVMVRLAATLLLANAIAVAGQEPVDLATIAKIKEEGLQRSQVLTTFNMFTNVIGPRLTGTPAHKAAADWSRQQLEKWGLSNARLDPFDFGRGWTLEKLTLE